MLSIDPGDGRVSRCCTPPVGSGCARMPVVQGGCFFAGSPYRFEENDGGAGAQIYKVVLEFNRTDCFDVMSWELNGEENKYLSFEKVSSVPDDLTK